MKTAILAITALFLILPLIVAVSAPYWIQFPKYIREIFLKTSIFDLEEVAKFESVVTIRKLRNENDLGNKIVICHYFKNQLVDLADKLRLFGGLATAGIFIISSFLITKNASKLLASTDDEIKKYLLDVMVTFGPMGVSVSTLVFFLVILVHVRTEAAKFKSILT